MQSEDTRLKEWRHLGTALLISSKYITKVQLRIQDFFLFFSFYSFTIIHFPLALDFRSLVFSFVYLYFIGISAWGQHGIRLLQASTNQPDYCAK